jgi:hypothetical protein
MRLSTLLAATLSAMVVVAWFLWPCAEVPKDPVGSALAALRAVTLGATPSKVARRDERQHVTELEGLEILFVRLWRKPRGAR